MGRLPPPVLGSEVRLKQTPRSESALNVLRSLVRLLSLLLVKPAENDAGEAKVSAIHESASEWETPRRSDARFFSSLQVVAKLDFGVVAALYERRLTWAGPGFGGHRLPLQDF